jgi:hypothetical protein
MPAGHRLSSKKTDSPGANVDSVGWVVTTFVAAPADVTLNTENRSIPENKMSVERFIFLTYILYFSNLDSINKIERRKPTVNEIAVESLGT